MCVPFVIAGVASVVATAVAATEVAVVVGMVVVVAVGMAAVAVEGVTVIVTGPPHPAIAVAVARPVAALADHQEA